MNKNSSSRNGTGGPGDDTRLRDLMRAVRRNWVLVLGIPALVFVATAAFVMMVTPIYQQSTSIRIEDKKPNIPMLDVEMLPQLGGGSTVETEMEVLRSRVIAEDVVESLQLQLVVEEPRRTLRQSLFEAIHVGRETPPGEYRLERQSDGRYRAEVEYRPEEAGSGWWPFPRTVVESLGEVAVGAPMQIRGGAVELRPGAAAHESIRFRVDEFNDAVQAFREHSGVSRPTREAALVVATYLGPDPVIVRDATNAIAHSFIAHREEHTKSEALSTERFLGDQISTLSLQLADAEESLMDFREANLVISPEAQASAQIERLALMQGERDAIAAERSALGRLLQSIEAAQPTEEADSSRYRLLIGFPTLFRNPAASELLAQLAEVENERALLLNRRTMDDVDVRVLTARIRDIERQLHNLASTYLLGLREQVQSLDATLAGYRGQLEQIPETEIEYGRLMRRARVLNEVYLTLQNRLKEAEMAVAVEDLNVRVIDPAILPDEPVKPNIPVSLGFALLLGGILGVGAATAREALDTTVRTRDDLQETLGLTVLGSIPRIEEEPTNGKRRFGVGVSQREGKLEPRLVSRQDPRSPYAEAYRSLRTNITFAVPDSKPRTLVFTSSMPGDGKSTTASNLAITLAQQDVAVLLVDADMRRAELHELFGRAREPGLSDVIRGRVPFEDALQQVAMAEHGALDFLGAGSLPPNPSDLLGSDRLKALIEGWKARYEMVILDAPPMNVVTDAAILGTHADGVLLVVRSGVTDRAGVSYALEQLQNVRAPLLGTVLNDVDSNRDAYAASAARAYSYGQPD